MKNLKTFAMITTLLLTSNVFAVGEGPLATLTSDLQATLNTEATSKNLSEMTKLAEDRNTDIDIAFQNYLIAKKRVSIARAAFNPITTGHVLGMALGMTYLWAPIAVEAVLSIPTKLYNVSSNKYLAQAALYNSEQARLALSNEMAHLYYDVITHEVILKSIDKEIEVLLFQQNGLKTASRIESNKSTILALKMERVDIYNLYVEELAAMKTLLTMDPSNQFKLAQTAVELDKSFLEGINQEKLQDLALIKSNEYKTSVNIRHAAQSNVKSVQWSILSFSGLNFSYKARVREAKIDEGVAESQQMSTELKVKNSSLIQLNNLDAALSLFDNYKSISNVSMGLFNDTYQLYQIGNATEDAAVETSIGAIQDFRSKVVAHYSAWSALNDFSKAVNVKFDYTNSNDRAQVQLEKSPLYDVSATDFKVAIKNDYSNSFSLVINSGHTEIIQKVEYKFDGNSFPSQTSTRDRKDFVSYFQRSETTPNSFSGTATIILNNGHEFTVDFKF